jgi:hypothetical protein
MTEQTEATREPVAAPVTQPSAPGAVRPAVSQPIGALSAHERDLLHGLLSRTVSYRLVIRGDAGPKELGNLIKILEMQKSVLEDGDQE